MSESGRILWGQFNGLATKFPVPRNRELSRQEQEENRCFARQMRETFGLNLVAGEAVKCVFDDRIIAVFVANIGLEGEQRDGKATFLV